MKSKDIPKVSCPI